jgi:hypothetical protein
VIVNRSYPRAIDESPSYVASYELNCADVQICDSRNMSGKRGGDVEL